jgi:hypothetical protein
VIGCTAPWTLFPSFGPLRSSARNAPARLLESYVKTLEATDLEERLKKLEKVISQ